MKHATSSVPPVPLWLLVLITLSGTLGMHMFVPALPQAASELCTDPALMQLTISLYIAGLAVGQIFYGPISDAFGRRRLLCGALVIYTVAGVLAACSNDVYALIATRLLQAIGGCAGLVLDRAIVKDTASGNSAIQKLALLSLMALLGPGLAPLIGGLVVAQGNWRAVLLVLAAFGATTLAFCLRLLPETSVATGPLNVRKLSNDYLRLLRSPLFMGWAIGGGAASTSFYAFLSAAPFIFADQLNRPLTELGIYLVILMIGVSAGNALTSRMIQCSDAGTIMFTANVACLVSASSLVVFAMLDEIGLGTVMGSMFVFAAGTGAMGPIAMAKALESSPRLAGSASALYGFIQMTIGAMCTGLVSLGGNPAVAAGAILATMTLVARFAFAVASRHDADRPSPTSRG